MWKNATRITRHMLLRAIMLFATVVVGVYITVLIANMGGYLDTVRKAEIRFATAQGIYANPDFQQLPPAELNKLVEQLVQIEYQRQGLDKPFIVRSFGYLATALSLSLGRSEHMTSDSGSRQVRLILVERLPATLVLFATTQMILFFLSLFVALYLSRNYGNPVDRAIIALAPTSAAPGWFYGIFLILIFSAVLRVLPWGGMVQTPPPKDTLSYALSVLKHMVLPVSAMIIGALFASIYARRTFFLIFSSEDYVELAKAKGLSERAVERRYVLRPTLPTIVTQFVLVLITMWTGAIVLETVFNWPGLGRLLYQGVQLNDTPVIVGGIVIYAYLLAISVFLLDIIYVILDPRVRIGGAARR